MKTQVFDGSGRRLVVAALRGASREAVQAGSRSAVNINVGRVGDNDTSLAMKMVIAAALAAFGVAASHIVDRLLPTDDEGLGDLFG